MINDEERQAALTKMAWQEFGINMKDFCVKNSNVRTANFNIFNEEKFIATLKDRYTSKQKIKFATKIQSWIRMI
jgi:hypothetical protein